MPNIQMPRVARDTVLFVGGLLGLGYETIVGKTDRPELLFIFGAMIGLPAFLRADEKRAPSPPPPPDPPPPPPPPAAPARRTRRRAS